MGEIEDVQRVSCQFTMFGFVLNTDLSHIDTELETIQAHHELVNYLTT